MELFLHTPGREHPELIEIEATAVVRELLVDTEPDGSVWIEEVDDVVDRDMTLEEAGIRHRHHIHRGRCHRVEVLVRFNGPRKEHHYGPGTTIKTVYQWASGLHGFALSPDQAAKHVLAVPGADTFLESGVHIGSLVSAESCEVILDLLPRDRFAG
jgi:hypothetical protein